MNDNAKALLMRIVSAAAMVDRENLDNAIVPPEQYGDDEARRATLRGPARELSDALLAAVTSDLTVAMSAAAPDLRYFEVVGASSGKVMGVTTDIEAVLAEEPGARFCEIPRVRYEAYAAAPWTTPTGRPYSAPQEDPV